MRTARIRDSSNGARLKLKDAESAFVFGGDLFDRGPGDLRLARELIDLKKKLGKFDDTPWKINMEPENDGLEDEFPFQLGDF